MTTGKTILCQKDPGKGNAVDSYQPISCLPHVKANDENNS